MDRRIAKFAATSLVTGVLSLGFAVATHAADSSLSTTYNHAVTTTVTTHKSDVNGSQTSNNSSSSDQPNSTVGSAGNSSQGSGSDQTNLVSDTSVSSQTAVTASSSGNSDTTTTIITKSSTGGSDQSPTGMGSGDQTGSGSVHVSGDGSQSPSSVGLMTPTPVTPELSRELHASMFQSTGRVASASQAEPSYGAAVPVAVSPSSSSTPTSSVPAKNLPIQGALAGISSTLSTTTLPLRQLAIVLVGGVKLSLAIALMLVLCVVALVEVVASRRFVDELKASGYSHAARADASDSIFSFATPSKVSFAWAPEPSQKLTFFGVKNKALTFQIS